MKLKRSPLIAGLAAGALLLTACGGSSDSDENGSTTSTEDGGTETDEGGEAGPSTGIVTTNGTEPQNALIPTDTNEVGGGKILDLIFAGLVSYEADGTTVNEIAKSFESDDNLTWTIEIEDGWEFTNGEPVVAASFVEAWKEGAYRKNSYFFEDIEGWDEDEASELTGLEVVDEHTFTVTLTEPTPDFPLHLGYSAYYPLPESALEDIDAFGQNPIGNGPYQLASDDAWQHDVQIELVPNEDYDGVRQVQNGGVTIKFYSSQDSAYQDLLANQLDVLDAIPDSAFATYQEDLGDRWVSQGAAIFQSFTISTELDHFKMDEEGRLRRAALSHAINREEITETIFEGTREPAHDFTSPVVAGFSETIPGSEVLEYDPEKAKELWDEADAISQYNDTFTIGYNADGGHQAWVDATNNSIKNVLGIEAEANAYPGFAEFRTDVTERTITGAFRTGWQADYPSMSNFLGPLYATGAGANDGDYSNPDFDQLVKEGNALIVDDEDAAIAKFQEAQEVLFQDLPAIPLWYATATGGWSELVQNVEFGWNSVPLFHEITKEA